MNIDYASILETANRRKNALRDIEALVAQAPHALNEMQGVRIYLNNLAGAWAALDHEGRRMLPQDVQGILTYASHKASLASQIVGDVSGLCSQQVGLMQLAPFAKDPQ